MAGVPVGRRIGRAAAWLAAAGLVGGLVLGGLLVSPKPAPPEQARPGRVESLGRLPLSFVPNAGQTDPAVRFLARGVGGTLFFGPSGVTLLPTPRSSAGGGSTAVRLRLEGASPTVTIAAGDLMPGVTNYLLGGDPTRWRTGLPNHGSIVYQQVYPGIDLHYEGEQDRLKGTYQLVPGADPSQIRWRYEGAVAAAIDPATGDLIVTLPIVGGDSASSALIERAPVAWQEIGGRRAPVEVRYELAGDGSVAFALGNYDPMHRLTIDPTLVYATLLGGAASDDGSGIAVDAAGGAYVVGATSSTDFPTLNPTLQPAAGVPGDAFVAKLGPSGQLVYATYVGGDGSDGAAAVALDGAGNVYVAGTTGSTAFATTVSHGTLGSQDAFALKLGPTGALVYGARLGGTSSDAAASIAVDAAGDAYVVGVTWSTNFPSTSDGMQPTAYGDEDGFVVKLGPTGSLAYGTYLGGAGADRLSAIALDGAGGVYVAGGTRSSDLPARYGLQPAYGGRWDGFVTKLNPANPTRTGQHVYTTYLGGSEDDDARGLAVDGAGSAYVVGVTWSTNFPTANALKADLSFPGGGPGDAFVVKLAPDGRSLVYGTYLGGWGGDDAYAVAIDAAGSAHVVGYTASADFPTTHVLRPLTSEYQDGFVVKLSPDGRTLSFATRLGGSFGHSLASAVVVDAAGVMHIAGITTTTDFAGAANLPSPNQGTGSGEPDVFVVKIDPAEATPTPTVTSTPTATHSPTPTATGTATATPTRTPTPRASIPTSPGSYPACGGSTAQNCISALAVDGAPAPAGIAVSVSRPTRAQFLQANAIRAATSSSPSGGSPLLQIQLTNDNNPDRYELSPALSTDSQVVLTIKLDEAFTPAVTIGAGAIERSAWDAATRELTIVASPHPSSWSRRPGCGPALCAEQADADYRAMLLLAVDPMDASAVASSQSGQLAAFRTRSQGGFVATNAQYFASPTYDPTTGAIEFEVGSPRLDTQGVVNSGFFRAFIPDPVVKDLWGVADPATLVAGTGTTTTVAGQGTIAPTIRRVEATAASPAGLVFESSGFHYSTPRISIAPSQSARQVRLYLPLGLRAVSSGW